MNVTWFKKKNMSKLQKSPVIPLETFFLEPRNFLYLTYKFFALDLMRNLMFYVNFCSHRNCVKKVTQKLEKILSFKDNFKNRHKKMLFFRFRFSIYQKICRIWKGLHSKYQTKEDFISFGFTLNKKFIINIYILYIIYCNR
jgi:hypothetical protein